MCFIVKKTKQRNKGGETWCDRPQKRGKNTHTGLKLGPFWAPLQGAHPVRFWGGPPAPPIDHCSTGGSWILAPASAVPRGMAPRGGPGGGGPGGGGGGGGGGPAGRPRGGPPPGGAPRGPPPARKRADSGYNPERCLKNPVLFIINININSRPYFGCVTVGLGVETGRSAATRSVWSSYEEESPASSVSRVCPPPNPPRPPPRPVVFCFV
jgi:hypothetical protein